MEKQRQAVPLWERKRGGLARGLGGLLALAVAFAAAFVLLAAMGWVDSGFLTPLGIPLERLLAWPQHPTLVRLGIGAAALLVGVIALASGGRTLRGGSASGTAGLHILAADEHGMVVVDSRGICSVAAAAVCRTPGVVDLRVDVAGQGSSPIRVLLTLWVSAAADLKKAGDEARHKAAEAIERLIGVQVQEVAVRLRVVPLEELGRLVR